MTIEVVFDPRDLQAVVTTVRTRCRLPRRGISGGRNVDRAAYTIVRKSFGLTMTRSPIDLILV